MSEKVSRLSLSKSSDLRRTKREPTGLNSHRKDETSDLKVPFLEKKTSVNNFSHSKCRFLKRPFVKTGYS